MKKLLIIPFLIISLFSLAQFPNTLPLGGAPKTLSTVLGGFKPLGGYVNLVFADTTAANAQPYLKFYNGAFIQTVGGISWNRYNNTWVQAGSGSSISLTTTGSTGAATLVGSTLNIPNYDINIQQSYTTTTQLSDTSWILCRFNGTCDTFRITNTGGGSGGGNPAGNYNDVQINRYGFATPLLDSLLFSAGLSVKGTGTYTSDLIGGTSGLGVRMGSMTNIFSFFSLTKAPPTLFNYMLGGDSSIGYLHGQDAFNITIGINNRALYNYLGMSLYPNNYATAAMTLPPGTTAVSTAPLKLVLSGAALLAVTEAGAVEAVSNTPYFTGVDLVRRALLTSNTGWATTGNSGTTVASNFFGTTDNVGLKFKINNILSGYFDLVEGNMSLGDHSMTANTTGSNNTAFGRYSLNANTTGNSNTAVGSAALLASVGLDDNTAIGKEAMITVNSGTSNVAIGKQVLGNLSSNTSLQNTVIGSDAMTVNTNSSDNALVGYNAFSANTTGSYNTAVGSSVGATNTTGSFNTFLGYGVSGTTATTRYSIGLGYPATPRTYQFYISDSILRWKSKGLSLRPSSTLNYMLFDSTGNGDLVLSGNYYKTIVNYGDSGFIISKANGLKDTVVISATSGGTPTLDEVTNAGATTANAINTGTISQNGFPVKPYTILRQLISQSSTSDPTVVNTLENTTGDTYIWARVGVGEYTITATGAVFTADKTSVIFSLGHSGGGRAFGYYELVSTGVIKVWTFNTSGVQDDILDHATFTVMIDP